MTERSHRERKDLVLERPPSRRLFNELGFRSFKSIQDRGTWDGLWTRIEQLQEEGWVLDGFAIDFGRSLPLSPTDREQKLRELCRGYPVEWSASGASVGRTVVKLYRDARGGRAVMTSKTQ